MPEARSRTTKATRAPAPLADEVHVLVTLERATGKVTYDDEFSTPMETWSMLSQATAKVAAIIDEVNGVTVEPE